MSPHGVVVVLVLYSSPEVNVGDWCNMHPTKAKLYNFSQDTVEATRIQSVGASELIHNMRMVCAVNPINAEITLLCTYKVWDKFDAINN